MNKLKLILGLVAVAGAATIWTIQHQAELRLRVENESLQRQLERMAQLEADNERLSNRVAQANNALPNAQFTELLKLRGEVGLLRQQTNGLQKLREQNQQLQNALASRNSAQNLPTTNSPPKVPPLAVYPRASWTYAGYATPEAAFQSMNWAAANGNLKMLLDGLAPDMQVEFAKAFENKTEGNIADELKKKLSKTTQFSILKKDIHSDNEVVLTILDDANGSEDTPDNLVFQRINGQWKFAKDH